MDMHMHNNMHMCMCMCMQMYMHMHMYMYIQKREGWQIDARLGFAGWGACACSLRGRGGSRGHWLRRSRLFFYYVVEEMGGQHVRWE